MARIVLCVLHFRLGARYVEADPPFTAIEMDHSDSAREGCAVSTLTILSEPCDWRGAVQVRLAHACAPCHFKSVPPRVFPCVFFVSQKSSNQIFLDAS